MKTKTIILSNPNQNFSNSGRGILSFYIEDEILICKLRLYNITALDQFTKLAIYHENEVYSANLLHRNGCYESSLVGDFDIDKDFYAAVIDTSNNNSIIIAGGTYAGFFFESSLFEEKQNQTINESLSKNNFENNTPNIDFDNCKDCTNCKYKEYFYENSQKLAANFQPITNIEQHEQTIPAEEHKQRNSDNLLENIVPQFDYIFEKYPSNQELSKLIENSKFVDIEENSQVFSIGVIYEKTEIKYLCYAVKSYYNQPAPNELGEHFQWLPSDPEDPLSDGYYIVFQDAIDLKIVEF